jgi:formamidopyrimidine-DNA glycosylase
VLFRIGKRRCATSLMVRTFAKGSRARQSNPMPELPDITAYIHALEPRVIGHPLIHVRLASPFLLRTVQPRLADAQGRTVRELRRIGKRIAFGLDGDLWLVLHLMIAGRLHWRPREARLGGRQNLASFDFPNGSLVLTEAGSKRRASLHVLQGEEGLRSVDPGGIEVFSINLKSFRAALAVENRTLKRALTDPRLLSGIGNAYSDEILHAAQLSPVTLTSKLTDQQWETLFNATRRTLQLWIDRLVAEADRAFPEKVTAFREGMAVHGRFNQPCPRCGEKIQRIRYADNETNYCARCQTNGKLLADRSLSRLLKSDWPKTLDELEALKRR